MIAFLMLIFVFVFGTFFLIGLFGFKESEEDINPSELSGFKLDPNSVRKEKPKKDEFNIEEA